jgi:hypothetical protein
MEKKYYYAPELKYHQLRVKSLILSSELDETEGEETEAKGFGSFSFDEDEE